VTLWGDTVYTRPAYPLSGACRTAIGTLLTDDNSDNVNILNYGAPSSNYFDNLVEGPTFPRAVEVLRLARGR
jgi:hypothetical protein